MQAAENGWLAESGCWTLQRGPGVAACDGWLVELPASPAFIADALASGLPLVLAVADPAPLVLAVAETAPLALLDAADGFILPDDDEAAIAAVLARAVAPAGSLRVADGTAQIISALSAEASRIAAQLATLAEQREAPLADRRPIDAAMVRRLLRLRRDRARFFPEALFADPAWDILLDLTASRLEGGQEPVSSLCIAAAVPTTTALRWVRSLTDAGLIERRPDPFDARRSHVGLTDAAADAMFGWLRLFADQFAGR